MTSIKPPDGRSPIGPLTPSGTGATSVDAPQQPGAASFRAALSDVSEAGAQAVATSGAPGAAGADPIAQLAESVRSGALTPEQAVERLVDRALAGMERTLTEAQRNELSGLLRAALESDPTLGELRAALK